MFLLLLMRLMATIIHAALIFGFAPLLTGVVNKLRARLLGRTGPPITQPYRDLQKLLGKATCVPDTATDLYRLWPYVSFAAIAAAALLVPGFCSGLLTSGASDFIVFIGLLALARGAALLAAMETGFGFGGAAAGRDVLFNVFAEAALLLVVLNLVLIGHQPTIDGTVQIFQQGHPSLSVPLCFALVALLSVALAQSGRIPVDNPAGDSELAMLHEAMLLEYSGRYLLLFQYAGMLRLMMWMSLISDMFLPAGLGTAGAIFSWPAGLLAWLLKLLFLVGALSLFEVSTARMRVFRVPEFLGVAMLLGVLSAVFLFVAAGFERVSMIYPIAHCLDALMLLCALALLSQSRLPAMISLYRTQAFVLTAAAFGQGYAQQAADLYLTGLITLVINAIIVPLVLRRIVQRFNLIRAVETAIPFGLATIIGVALIGVAVLVVLPMTMRMTMLTHEDLAISLSIVLLGLLVMTTRRNPLSQVIGFLSTENGLVLTAISMPCMPFVAALSLALAVLTAFLLAGEFVLRERAHLDDLDLRDIAETKSRGR